MESVWVFVKMTMIAYAANSAMVSDINKQISNDLWVSILMPMK